jgi:hypothetical protein
MMVLQELAILPRRCMLRDLGKVWVLVLGGELIELDPRRLAVSVKLPHQLDELVHAFDACAYKNLCISRFAAISAQSLSRVDVPAWSDIGPT